MKVLIVGRGGREHALARVCSNSKLVSDVIVSPGNGGIKNEFSTVDINEQDVEKLRKFSIQNSICLTIVGPEVSLSSGIVDEFEKYGLKIFGPTKSATRIESSKEFAKNLMKKYKIPTAEYEVFDNYDSAIDYIAKSGLPIVIKYDGLAAGKGVVIVNTMEEAKVTLDLMLNKKVYGDDKVVIEEFLDGIEFSLMAMVKNENVYNLEISQDHKQLLDGDKGPNTGGMGAFSPVDIIKNHDIEYSMDNIMKPIAKAMVKENCPFCGFLYGGLILTKSGVKVIEFNARFGDPEAEVVLPRIESDFVVNILDVLDNNSPKLKWSTDYVVGVVMASNGYPASYDTNILIKGDLKNAFHMGTKYDNDYYTNGGRVLMVNGRASSLEEAIKNAYDNVNKIDCDNLIYRNDIGQRKKNG
ncbi:MAG: phosphoribosylamine--glycine ligase [Bacilli bacterium]